MYLEKSVFQFFIDSNEKHNIAHLLLMFYPYVQSENCPLSTFGEMARTRGRIYTKFT